MRSFRSEELWVIVLRKKAIKKELPMSYHVYIKDEKFVREGEDIYMVGKVYRRCNDKKTERLLSEEMLKENYAKVMYEITEDKVNGEVS